MIKPEFFTDEKVINLPIPARLLFIGMWNHADDEGIFKDSPIQLKVQVFPADETIDLNVIKNYIDLMIQQKLLIAGLNVDDGKLLIYFSIVVCFRSSSPGYILTLRLIILFSIIPSSFAKFHIPIKNTLTSLLRHNILGSVQNSGFIILFLGISSPYSTSSLICLKWSHLPSLSSWHGPHIISSASNGL